MKFNLFWRKKCSQLFFFARFNRKKRKKRKLRERGEKIKENQSIKKGRNRGGRPTLLTQRVSS